MIGTYSTFLLVSNEPLRLGYLYVVFSVGYDFGSQILFDVHQYKISKANNYFQSVSKRQFIKVPFSNI